MATKKPVVKKTTQQENTTPEVEVDVNAVTEEVKEEKTADTTTEQEEDVTVDETPEVEVDVPKDDEPEVDVDPEVNVGKKAPQGNVKIKMRVDHTCTVAMERYDLKAGKTYNVPLNVKRILNRAGLLSPL